MKGKRIKQINNLTIYQDMSKTINYFGEIKENPNYGKCSVWTPDGRCWEDRLTLEQAEDFCRNTKDFLAKVDHLIQNAQERRINTPLKETKNPIER